MSALTDLNAKIKQARRESQQEARAIGYKAAYSRGICFIAMKDDNRAPAFDPPWEVRGSYPTKRELDEAIAQCLEDGCDELCIDGGFDGADSPRDYQEGVYDPQVTYFEVDIPLPTPNNLG